MKSLHLIFILGLSLFSCTQETLTSREDIPAEAARYIQESEAADAAAEAEIADYAASWISFRSPVTVPAGSVDALADAVAQAGPGGTVRLAAGLHTENSPVLISESVRIEGMGDAELAFPNAPAPEGIPMEMIPSLHVKDATNVWLKDFAITTGDAPGGRIAVLIQDAPRTRVEGLTISDHQYGIFLDGGNNCQIVSNTLNGTLSAFPSIVNWGITNSTGQRTLIAHNTVDDYNSAIFLSDRAGNAFKNTVSNSGSGILWCTVPAWQFYPDGEFVQAAQPARGWRGHNNTAINSTFGFLIIDGANSSFCIQNESINAGLYDIEIVGESERFGFSTPASRNSKVISVGKLRNQSIKDCTGDNLIIGGQLVDTEADPCF